ncbi:universal stress protein [Desulfovibrio aerotolerans]|uniref:Universal stress protein n=1 Tax=Solidesulfovibrio aerotolerans TaxID=295255 RepID=A0A7C9N077_9BACT|nr:universal stress protein [Solidesulfovibrio aerotolerans]MYL82171.1 universal stress protein [Solidesulfovibrio aerotolerans]
MHTAKILIAYDGSDNARRAVSYTAAMVGSGGNRLVDVAAIERPADRDLFADDAAWKAECARRIEAMRTSLNEARAMLVAAGVPEAAVTTRFVESCRSPLREAQECSIGTSIALEILRLAEEGGYDTVVVGRRGVSKQEEFLFGSVSTKIIHAAKGLAVWVVA